MIGMITNETMTPRITKPAIIRPLICRIKPSTRWYMAMTKAIAEASNTKSGKPNNKKIAPPVKKANVVREQNAKTPTMIEPHIIIGFL